MIFLVAASWIGLWVVRTDLGPQTGVLSRVFGFAMLAAGSVTADLFIAAWVLAFALLAHVLLRVFEAIAWRVVEYQRGAWAAVVAIATAVLAAVDLYLKRP